MKAIKYIAAVLVMATGLIGSAAFAGDNSSAMAVSARVLSYMTKTIVNNGVTIRVTDKDIERGYVDVSGATTVYVKTNSGDGYMLSFAALSGPFTEVMVIDGTRSTVISSDGGFIYQSRTNPKTGETKLLNYRFYLAKHTAPGSYSWPVMVDVVAN